MQSRFAKITSRPRRLIITGLVSLLVACVHPVTDTTQAKGRQVDLTWGEKVYQNSCADCHDSGRNGAQIIGDTAGWSSRINRGIPSLVKNAIEGYNGALGYMPPRGGNPTLSHEDVSAATLYIISVSRSR